MSTVKSFPDKYITKVSTILMTDEVINKMLYYNNECNVDIYSLPEVKNPIKELREKKVFCNRRVEKVFLQGDISIFINLRKDNPASINGKTSRFIETLGLEIGVICHESCRRTLNGARESVVFDRLQYLLKNTEILEGIGKPHIQTTSQTYSIPYEYNAYILSLNVNYFSDM